MIRTSLSALALLLASVPVAAQDYRTFKDLQQTLQTWSRQHAAVVKLESMGKSAGGRDLWTLRLAQAGPKDPDQRQAVWVGANAEGYHLAATEAALDLAKRLVEDPKTLGERTFYIAPCLNPDAFEATFKGPRQTLSGNDLKLDKDVDGLLGEDPAEDLDKDGRITQIRILDPLGDMLPDPADPRRMIKADPTKGQRGTHKVHVEGWDNDGDGQWNEDGPGGVRVDQNFPHGFQHGQPESGPWAGYAPEARAAMDHLVAHRNVALAVVFGPANTLLEVSRVSESDPSASAATPPTDPGRANRGQGRMGQGGQGQAPPTATTPRPNAPSTPPQALERTAPQGLQGRGGQPGQASPSSTAGWEISREQSPVPSRPDSEDRRLWDQLGAEYRRTLDKAGLDARRAVKSPIGGSLFNWIYYVYGAQVVALDVWGLPRAKAPEGAPRATRSDLLAFVDASAPKAFTPWSPLTLPNGTPAEVGGVDPLLEHAPPYGFLTPALAPHTDTILALAAKLPKVEIEAVETRHLGSGVYKIRAIAVNKGELPTHTRMGARARGYLPVHMELKPGEAKALLPLQAATSERLEGRIGTLVGEWMIQGKPGQTLTVEVKTQNAGGDRRTITLGKEK